MYTEPTAFRTGHSLKGLLAGIALGMMFATPVQANVDIAQKPIFLGGVPGLLTLVPSVEWPTINSVANLDENYAPDKEFAGYFDSNKCYQYQYSATESERHFYPIGTTSNRICSGNQWSGNFLNWATTQTIDPFRKALTGGYRVKDTATETWLEKARHDGQGGTGIFPNRRLPGSGDSASVVAGATPFSADWIGMRIEGLGNKMRFRLESTSINTNVSDYNPANAILTNQGYELSVRVKVCDSPVGVESNCKQYSQGWKPEGTIQQYADGMRYSVFGYLNDSSSSPQRDGGVLRAKAKYVGPTIPSGNTTANNPNKEWDPNTGVLIKNPDSADASATGNGVADSGVINYLNKFGQMTTQNHKSYDPVSELYYSAIRYLKNLGNVSSYSSMSGSTTDKYNLADGFPVITNWPDPVPSWCQANVILGIGDVYTHNDKNLPGTTSTSGEPSMPSAVSSDSTVNVNTATQKVAQLEGISIGTPFTGRGNSAYMAGLAYDSHTKDIRPDLSGGKTTISTYWVDVLEAQTLEPIEKNQYWLAAKYGGFRVPDTFDPYTHSTALPLEWWSASGDMLTSFGSSNVYTFPRPDNYFTAGDALSMVSSLTKAFERISNETEDSSTSSAASSATLQTNTLLYTAGFRSKGWTGKLEAWEINADGSLGKRKWDAEAELATKAAANSRDIFTVARSGINTSTWEAVTNGVALDGTLDGNQDDALDYDTNGTNDGLASERLDWLFGTKPFHSTFRPRSGEDDSGATVDRLLGDIINSNPQFVSKRDYGYRRLTDHGASYQAYRLTTDYQNRPDMLYVGANDGMLHGFDAQTGVEHFAYLPSELLLPEPGDDFARINQLMAQDYQHRYFVDGTPAIWDAYLDGAWKTVLVGTMGAGGRTVFALDVSDPQNFSANDILWEFTDPDLGYGVDKPTIVRMKNGDWAAVFGNGYNSQNHKAVVYIVNLADGALLAKINTDESADTAASPNGMSTPTVTLEADMTAKTIYAGDLKGHLWRMDVTDTNKNSWDNQGNRVVLFQAMDSSSNPQPITSAPEVAVDPNNKDNLIVVFGTGSYFRNQDAASTQIQSLYGIIDDGSTINLVRGDLLEQVITLQDTVTIGGQAFTLREVSNNSMNGENGWRLDLIYNTATGERVVSKPTLLSGAVRDRVRFTTLIPDPDPCGAGSTGFLMDFMIASGGRADRAVFDLNDDGSFNASDLGNCTGSCSGLSFGSGEEVIVIQDGDNKSRLYTGDGESVAGSEPGALTGRQSWRQLR